MDNIVKEMIHIFDQTCNYNFCTSKIYFKKSGEHSAIHKGHISFIHEEILRTKVLISHRQTESIDFSQKIQMVICHLKNVQMHYKSKNVN